MPLPRSLARFNRVATNRIALPLASRLPSLAVLIHRGRTSGNEYRTPVNSWIDDRTVLVPLVYGREADWLKNLQSAGEGSIVSRGREYRIDSPVVVGPEAADVVPAMIRLVLSLISVDEFVGFPVLSQARPT